MYRRVSAASALVLFGLVALTYSTDDSTSRVFLLTPQTPPKRISLDPALRSVQSIPAAVTAAAVTFHAEAAHAKSVLGVNGALDFGPLAGDQPGGEGTGQALGINDDSLGFVLIAVVLAIGFAFAQWQSYQDDDDDFFDTYDSRRGDREGSRM
jgi:hypothetical protein